MRPGAWTPVGLLTAADSLAAVLARDAETLHRLGDAADELAARLRTLLDAAGESDWARPTRVDSYEVELHRRRGFLTCPWAPEEFAPCPSGPNGRPTANEFVITRRTTGDRLEGFELGIHLIGAHAFFGGPGTPFRIDPELLAALLAT